MACLSIKIKGAQSAALEINPWANPSASVSPFGHASLELGVTPHASLRISEICTVSGEYYRYLVLAASDGVLITSIGEYLSPQPSE